MALLLQVNDFSADAVISQLLLLDSQSPNKVDGCHCCHVQVLCSCCSLLQTTRQCTGGAFALAQDIKLFINSPGGSVTAGMGIYDAMMVRQHASCQPPIVCRSTVPVPDRATSCNDHNAGIVSCY
jgi:Clp protease